MKGRGEARKVDRSPGPGGPHPRVLKEVAVGIVQSSAVMLQELL